MKSHIAALMLALGLALPLHADVTVEEIIPSSAPAGARVLVRGAGLDDPAITVTFSAASPDAGDPSQRQRAAGRAPELRANVLSRSPKELEFLVPSAAASGTLRIGTPSQRHAGNFTVLPQRDFIRATTVASGLDAPNGIAVSPGGDVFITEQHQIRRVAPSGDSTVLAGRREPGFVNGRGAEAAFASPAGIVFDPGSGALFVADSGNHAIRGIAPDGTVTTIAGGGTPGFSDGRGSGARFNSPTGLALAADGTIYVSDSLNHRIRTIDANGAVSTLQTDVPLNEPGAVAWFEGRLYVAEPKQRTVRVIDGGRVTTISDDALGQPDGLAIDGAGRVIIADAAAGVLRRLGATTVAVAGTTPDSMLHVELGAPASLLLAGALLVTDPKTDSVRMLCSAPVLTAVLSDDVLREGDVVRLAGSGFVPGRTRVTFGNLDAASIRWIDSSVVVAEAPAGVASVASIGVQTCGGSSGAVDAGRDSHAPRIEVLDGTAPLRDGAIFGRSVVPLIQVTDDDDPAPVVTATLDGSTFVPGTTIASDGVHTLVVTARDASGKSAVRQVSFTIDRTAPVVEVLESGSVLASGAVFGRDVILTLKISDITTVTTSATIDGVPYVLGTPIGGSGLRRFTATVTDAAGNRTAVGPLEFAILRGEPKIEVIAPRDGELVPLSRVIVRGTIRDAAELTLNDVRVPYDAATGTFAFEYTLLEGENALVLKAIDPRGPSASARLRVVADTRAPELAVVAPPRCTNATRVTLTGSVTDAHLDRVALTVDGTSVPTNLDAARSSWSASFDAGSEGERRIAVEATDAAGHRSARQLSLVVDRTPPAITIANSGPSLEGTDVNRTLSFSVSADDVDDAPLVTATLDGQPYVNGTTLTAGEHRLAVVATDCAGNRSEMTRTVRIDLDAPVIRNLAPAHRAKIGRKPDNVTGETDADVVLIEASGASGRITSVVPANGRFSLSLPFDEGDNRFTLVATDRAGNRADLPYLVTMQSGVPAVLIVESQLPIENEAFFNRDVVPAVVTDDALATATLTIDGVPHSQGTPVTGEGRHVAVAVAKNAFGIENRSEVAFTIDKTPPAVKIVAPVSGSGASASMDVQVLAADAESVTVNGAAAVKGANGSWRVAALPLEALAIASANQVDLIAAGRDRAGNIGRDLVSLTTSAAPPAVVLMAPANGSVTNRARTDVRGYVVEPGGVSAVSLDVNGAVQALTLDPSGAFQVPGVTLREGANAIAVIARRGSSDARADAAVTLDVTPPSVRMLASGKALEEGAQFADAIAIAVEASDGGGEVATELVLDGARGATTRTVSDAGSHLAIATARDAAGNESRIQRTFAIGTGGASACRLNGLDPANGTVISASSVTIAGRSGDVPSVSLNGVAVPVTNGSFAASVELPHEGANEIVVRCLDAGGAAIGEAVTLTLHRVTGDPSVTILSPAEGELSTSPKIAVSGTVSADVTRVDVNGAAATLNGTTFNAPAVRLTNGTNVIVVRATNAASRSAVASRRVTYLAEMPSITITSPAASTVTGAGPIDVTGTWRNLDPATITASVSANEFAGTTTSWSDTSGTFTIGLSVTAGEQTIAVKGRDRAGRLATATVSIRVVAGGPSIAIESPRDNTFIASGSGEAVEVSGTFSATPGSIVDVNGVLAAITGNTFRATVPLSVPPAVVTPVVARVSQPDGGGAFDTIRLTRFASAPRVVEVFPADASTNVERGALVVILFSNPMESASLRDAVNVERADGSRVTGSIVHDRDVATFVPSALLEPGVRYTVRIASTARDLAGNALAASWSGSFITSSTAPATAPSLDPLAATLCATTLEVRGAAPAGMRVRIDHGGISFETTATDAGRFSFTLPIGGRSGHQVVRVRTIGSDGTLSPAAEASFLVDCSGPRVTLAAIDRAARRIDVRFSKPIAPGSMISGSTVRLARVDGTPLDATITFGGPADAAIQSNGIDSGSVTLTLTDGITGVDGSKLVAFAKTFEGSGETAAPAPGTGFVSGEVFDASTGRPLPDARIEFLGTNAQQLVTDVRGRYAARLAEGVHRLRVAHDGYTTAWRQVIVAAGAGVALLDVRLTPNGINSTSDAAVSLAHGGESALTARVQFDAPAASGSVTLTSLSAQALPAALPSGWSPYTAAEIATSNRALAGASLRFTVREADLTTAVQTLTAVRYDDTRDEWRVVAPVASSVSGVVTLPISAPGAYALVYADRAPHLAKPLAPLAGAALQGVADPCASTPCPAFVKQSFVLDPPVVLPDGRSIATLAIAGAGEHRFPSGTPVQAWITEDLKLADGSRTSDVPFAADVLLYRDLAGTTAIATFALAPSRKAVELMLESGVEQIDVLPYPGSLDRGSIIGPEGGRVAGDGPIEVDIETGATGEPLRASVTPITDLAQFGTIAGFRVDAAFALSLQRTSASTEPVELSVPARVTLPANGSGDQHVIAEVVEDPFFGRVFRLAALLESRDGSLTTKTIDRTQLPLDGVVRDGRFLVLTATQPIAFATGLLRLGNNLPAAGARVTPNGLGLADLSRMSGIYNLPVVAKPAAPFTLTPRSRVTGDSTPYTHATAPDPSEIVRVADLTLVAQPPRVISVFPADGARDVSVNTFVKVTLDPGIDASSVTPTSLVVLDASATAVPGTLTLDGSSALLWKPATSLSNAMGYTVVVAASVRGLSGAPLGASFTSTFSTVAKVISGDIDATKIRITIPDANGASRIVGAAGALPANWIGVAVRRGRDFTTMPQATAAVNGSFEIALRGVTVNDRIDLRVVNTAGAVAAIIPLTPFVDESGRAFIAPPGVTTTFTSIDGISVTVPDGAFDVPTRVTVTPADIAPLRRVPSIQKELTLSAFVRLEFDGKAKKRLDVQIPLPAGFTDTGRELMLGMLASSIRGPRVMIVDPIRIDGSRFTTSDPPAATRAASVTASAFTGRDVRRHLMGVTRSGLYAVVNATEGALTWVTFSKPGELVDLFWTTMESLFAAWFYVADSIGTIAIPVPSEKAFTIEGDDAATGFRSFSRSYPPPVAGPIEGPSPDLIGPYPVEMSPGRLDSIELVASRIVSRDVTLKLSEGSVAFEFDRSVAPELQTPRGASVQAVNLTTGQATYPRIVTDTTTLGSLSASRYDRILMLRGETDVAPVAPIRFVFNEPLVLGPDRTQYFSVERREGETWIDLTASCQFTVDEEDVVITPPGRMLKAGTAYRVTLKSTIVDASGKHLAERTQPDGGSSGGVDLVLVFKVRDAVPPLATFDLVPSPLHTGASLADMTQHGNILFASARDGGLLAYDLSDPAALRPRDGVQPKPFALVPARWKNGEGATLTPGLDEHWAVATDRHGRVITTGFVDSLSILRTYRVEDFVNARGGGACSGFASAPPNALCRFRGSAIIGWRPGTTASALAGALLSDRVEAIPRRVELLTKDDETPYDTLADFKEQNAGLVTAQPFPGDSRFERLSLRVVYRPDELKPYYASQRVTVVNLTRDLSWSADVPAGEEGVTISGILAAANDSLAILRNVSAYAVVTQFGYGISIFDVNAIESGDAPNRPSTYTTLREQIVSTRMHLDDECKYNVDASRAIEDASFAAEAALLPTTSGLVAFVPIPARGVLGGGIDLVKAAQAPSVSGGCVQRNAGIIPFDETNGTLASPRLAPIKQKAESLGRTFRPRYRSIGTVIGRGTTTIDGEETFEDDHHKFILVAAGDLGVLVFNAGLEPSPMLTIESLSSIIWIPDGAVSIRVSQEKRLATVVDARGHVSLVRLDELDERRPDLAADALFPIAARALVSGAPGQFGANDARVIWRSIDPVVKGSMPPLLDVDTGLMLAGETLGKRMEASLVLDPEVRVLDANSATMTAVDAITPLGVKPKPRTADEPATTAEGVFRLEMTLPGGISDSLAGQQLRFTIASERIEGVETEALPAGIPPVKLTDVLVTRTVPVDLSQPALRYQKGFNRWMSDPVAAIADLRAAKDYDWPAGTDAAARVAAGCVACERSPAVAGDPSVREIVSAGRFFRITPTSGQAALAQFSMGRRLERRVPTIAADIVRDPRVQVAPQAPPVASGMLQETTYMHSGEVETSTLDLDAGGRAGWNVALDRTWRSRVMGLSPLGFGWDSSLFRRIRELPDGSAEYRDGAGEVWTFTQRNDGFIAPAGLQAKLVKTRDGWNLIDQKQRIVSFDSYGRIVAESDEFHEKAPDSGNVVRYLYGHDGRLERVVDPVGRETTLKWNGHGLLMQATDWRGRAVVYGYDNVARIESVKLPEVGLYTGDVRPTQRYAYTAAPFDVTSLVDSAPLLASITDPGAENARVTFTYEESGAQKGRITSQKWATGEQASFEWTSDAGASNTDVLGQVRRYELVTPPGDRPHIATLTTEQVPVWNGAEIGQLPGTVSAASTTTTPHDVVQRFTYANGMLASAVVDGVAKVENTWAEAGGDSGQMLQQSVSESLFTPSASSAAVNRIAREFERSGNFLDSVSVNGATISTPEPSRRLLEPVATNDSIVAKTTYDAHGVVTATESTGGTDAGSEGSKAGIEYFAAEDATQFRRALPRRVERGGGLLVDRSWEYVDETTTIETDDRGLRTTTKTDALLRPVSVDVDGTDRPLRSKYEYDAAGRVTAEKFDKGGTTGLVETSYEYDALGRVKSQSTDKAAVEGGVLRTSTTYDLANRKITVTHPGGATTETTLDKLGRPERRVTYASTTTLEERFAYDLAGNLVFATDGLAATAYAYDAHGRRIGQRNADRTSSEITYDAVGNVVATRQFAADGSTIAETTADVTPTGRVESVQTRVDTDATLTSSFAWDGAGRSTASASGNRASRVRFDDMGRFKSSATGRGSLASIEERFVGVDALSWDGVLARSTATTEKGATGVQTERAFGTGGEVTSQRTGALEFKTSYDGGGSVTSASVPNRPAQSFETDGLGQAKSQMLEDGSVNRFEYDRSGALKQYTDPTSEATDVSSDTLGRPLARTYPDGTREEFEWQGSRLRRFTDRQGRTQEFEYDAAGRLWRTREGSTLIEERSYDAGGRLRSIRNLDSEIEYLDFNYAGLPRRTIQRRFANRSGLTTGSQQVIDEWTMEHRWNEHGERIAWSMPRYGNSPPGDGWTDWVNEKYDAMGNVVEIARGNGPGASTGSIIMTAEYRNAGRPIERTVNTGGGHAIRRAYGYDPTTGQLNRMEVVVDGVTVGGSAITYDGLQIAEARLLGVSANERFTRFAYDARSRVIGSIAGATGDASVDPSTRGSASEVLSRADFRQAQTRTQALDPLLRDSLRQRGINVDPVDPPSLALTERAGGGHKIASLQRGDVTRPLAWNGAELVDDGNFIYEFDVKGRLVRATEKRATAPKRRLLYFYNANGRVVGRRAETTTSSNPSEHEWQLDTSTYEQGLEDLPPDTTFVWDPITDRLVTVARTPNGLADAGDRIRKQIIHGGSGYDDPVAITSSSVAVDNGPKKRFYPVYDEAGNGVMQLLLDDDGNVAARNIGNDPYGGADVVIGGPSIDRIAITATKGETGQLSSVTVTMRLVDVLTDASVPTGARLAAVDAAGNVVATSTVAAAPAVTAGSTPNSSHTIEWKLTPSEWTSLTTASGAAAISIAATNTLRSEAWGADAQVLPPPDWAQATHPLFKGDALPIEYRESLAALSAFLAGVPAGGEKTSTLYEPETLPLLGTSDSPLFEEALAARFHAYPFADPATGLVYARARWYDPKTGTFITPDPLGYVDSSNLYAFAGGDPVNNRDPRGECIFGWGGTCAEWANAGKKKLDEVRQFVDRNTGSTIVDTAINAQVGFAVDAVDTFLLDPLRVGDATGTAVGTDASGGGLALAIVQDVGRGAAIAAGAGTAVKAGTRVIRGATAFDDIGAAAARGLDEGAVQVVDDLAPVFRHKPGPPPRPSWQTTEADSAADLAEFGFEQQVAFKDGVRVSRSTRGSVRPDNYSEMSRMSVDDKNYNVVSAAGRARLVRDVVEQAAARAKHLPAGSRQAIIIDVRGQAVNEKLLERMIDRIVRKSKRIITRDNILTRR